MNDYVTTLPFDEVRLVFGNIEVGNGYSGDAHIDEDGNVVGLTLDGFDEKTGDDRTVYFDVPSRQATGSTYWQETVSRIATWIENNCDVEIQERLDDWRASSDAPEYEPTTIADEFDGIRSDLRAIMEAK